MQNVDDEAVPPAPGEGGGELRLEQAVLPVVQAPSPQDRAQEEEEVPGQEWEVVGAGKARGGEPLGVAGLVDP